MRLVPQGLGVVVPIPEHVPVPIRSRPFTRGNPSGVFPHHGGTGVVVESPSLLANHTGMKRNLSRPVAQPVTPAAEGRYPSRIWTRKRLSFFGHGQIVDMHLTLRTPHLDPLLDCRNGVPCEGPVVPPICSRK